MNTETNASMRNYEAVVILHPDVSEADQKEFFKRNQKAVEAFKGQVNHIDTWGKRKLASPIKKMRLGQYFHTTFNAQGNCVAELERLMKIDDRVLRFTHVRLDDRTSLPKHVEDFHKAIQETIKREQEKEAKFQARRMGGGGGGGGGGHRGPRESNYGRKSRDEGTDLVVADDEDSGE